MDKFRQAEDNHELDDVGRLILELKDLAGDNQRFDCNGMDAQDEQDVLPVFEETVPVKKRRLMPIWLVALINILVGGAIIVTFALFHHVLPAMISAQQREEAKLHATEATIATQAPEAINP